MYALEHGIENFSPSLLGTAWTMPVARLYAEAGLMTQRPTAMCGPTSLALVLRSLGTPIAASKVLEGSSVSTFFGARIGGMSLDQMGEALAAKTAHAVTILRDLELRAFRAELAHVNDPKRRYIANFHRGPLFNFGGGHHSPLGAFLPEFDAVLVIDVNARIQPWVCSVPQLHRAISTRDPWMQKSRGLVRLSVVEQ